MEPVKTEITITRSMSQLPALAHLGEHLIVECAIHCLGSHKQSDSPQTYWQYDSTGQSEGQGESVTFPRHIPVL